MTCRPVRSAAAMLAIGLACPLAHAADPVVVNFPSGAPIGVSFKLLPPAGKVGRDNPFYDNYRPQVQFSGERERVTCAVRIPQPLEKVEPGQTVDVTLVCGDRVRVIDDRRSFGAYEGGRLVGEGQVR